jgi:hypothetical protein
MPIDHQSTNEAKVFFIPIFHQKNLSFPPLSRRPRLWRVARMAIWETLFLERDESLHE